MMQNNDTIMMDTAFTDTLTIVLTDSTSGAQNDSLQTSVLAENRSVSEESSGWLPYTVGVVILLLVVVTIAAMAYRVAQKRQDEKGQKGNVFDEVFDDVNNADKAKVLLKELKTKLHPDRFVSADTAVMEAAQKIFQELNESKHSYSELNRIRAKAIEQGLISE